MSVETKTNHDTVSTRVDLDIELSRNLPIEGD